MNTIKVEIQLFKLNELNTEAQQTAINEHFNFLAELGMEYENHNGEMITEYSDPLTSEVIDSIEANEYLFFKDGSLANVTHYTGTHERAGTTVFLFQGKEFIL